MGNDWWVDGVVVPYHRSLFVLLRMMMHRGNWCANVRAPTACGLTIRFPISPRRPCFIARKSWLPPPRAASPRLLRPPKWAGVCRLLLVVCWEEGRACMGTRRLFCCPFAGIVNHPILFVCSHSPSVRNVSVFCGKRCQRACARVWTCVLHPGAS